MAGWEYCVLTGMMGNPRVGISEWKPYYPQLWRFSLEGPEMVTDFSERPKSVEERVAVAQMIARLGEEGWEMVDCECGWLYFKRPKP